MRADLVRLQKELEMREREEVLSEVTNSKEFKSISRTFSRIGLSPEEITELFKRPQKPQKPRAVAKPRGKVPPKYRHPENQDLTWTGRGNKPRWVQELLEAGRSLEELLIKT